MHGPFAEFTVWWPVSEMSPQVHRQWLVFYCITATHYALIAASTNIHADVRRDRPKPNQSGETAEATCVAFFLGGEYICSVLVLGAGVIGSDTPWSLYCQVCRHGISRGQVYSGILFLCFVGDGLTCILLVTFVWQRGLVFLGVQFAAPNAGITRPPLIDLGWAHRGKNVQSNGLAHPFGKQKKQKKIQMEGASQEGAFPGSRFKKGFLS